MWLTAVSGCWIYDNLVRPCFEADEIVGPRVSRELVDLELHFSKLRILCLHQRDSKISCSWLPLAPHSKIWTGTPWVKSQRVSKG